MIEEEHRVRLPDQNPDVVRRELEFNLRLDPIFEPTLSLDQLTEERDIQTHPLGTVVAGVERHTNRQVGVARTAWATRK